MTRRRAWDSLSASYRGRLERGGITRDLYESDSGSLAEARGHKSSEHENARRRALRWARKNLALMPEGATEARRRRYDADLTGRALADIYDAIDDDHDWAWMADRLAEQHKDTIEYRKGHPDPGRYNWFFVRDETPQTLWFYH
jgi:hypothetical protein